MTRIAIGRFTIRVWRTVVDPLKVDNKDIFDLGHKLWMQMNYLPSPWDLAAEFEKLPDIAAIEVLYEDGNGVLIYPDWK